MPDDALYGAPANQRRQRRRFEAEYGKEHGDYVYGAVVGKVAREREAAKAEHDPMGTPNYRPASAAERRRALAEDTPDKRRHDAFVARQDAEFERQRNEAAHRNAERRADEMGTYEHVESHSEPSHHIGPCDESCRAGRRAHSHKLARMNVPRGTTVPSRGTYR